MEAFSVAHDSTTPLVLQTIDVYERSANECVARWRKRRHRRPPLLAESLTCLSAHARLLDLGCGGGKDANDLSQRGYRIVGLEGTSAWLDAFSEIGHTSSPDRSEQDCPSRRAVRCDSDLWCEEPH